MYMQQFSPNWTETGVKAEVCEQSGLHFYLDMLTTSLIGIVVQVLQ